MKGTNDGLVKSWSNVINVWLILRQDFHYKQHIPSTFLLATNCAEGANDELLWRAVLEWVTSLLCVLPPCQNVRRLYSVTHILYASLHNLGWHTWERCQAGTLTHIYTHIHTVALWQTQGNSICVWRGSQHTGQGERLSRGQTLRDDRNPLTHTHIHTHPNDTKSRTTDSSEAMQQNDIYSEYNRTDCTYCMLCTNNYVLYRFFFFTFSHSFSKFRVMTLTSCFVSPELKRYSIESDKKHQIEKRRKSPYLINVSMEMFKIKADYMGFSNR